MPEVSIRIDLETVSIRSGCSYHLFSGMPQNANEVRLWAVMARTVSPPGPLASGEQIAMIAAEAQKGGKWNWVALSPNARQLFGEIMADGNCNVDEWYIMVERDESRGE